MVRIAVRTLTLNVYCVDDPALRRFILDRSAVPYFSNLANFLRDEVVSLQELVNRSSVQDYRSIEEFMESVVDLVYYLQV